MSAAPRRSRPDLTFVSVVAVSAFYMFGFAAVFALLPKLRDRYGLETKWLGPIAASSVLCSVAAQVGLAGSPTGPRAPHDAHRHRLHGRGVRMVRVRDALWQFAGARAVVGLGGGMYSPAARRTVVARDPTRAGALLGTMVSVEVGGFMRGPPLALALYGVGGAWCRGEAVERARRAVLFPDASVGAAPR